MRFRIQHPVATALLCFFGRPLAGLLGVVLLSPAHAESSMGTSRAGGRASASASITITVTIPATVKKAPDGRSLKSNLGKSASCTMALLEDEPVPANLPHLDGTTCAITRITKAQHEAGAFRGWTVMP